jgi:hypothetical protein
MAGHMKVARECIGNHVHVGREAVHTHWHASVSDSDVMSRVRQGRGGSTGSTVPVQYL